MTVWMIAESAGFRTGQRWLLREANLALAAGQFTVVIGPNGAGKSTLLRLLSGEWAPAEGHVMTLGQPIGAVPAWQLAARRVVMAQGISTGFPFAVHEVVALGAVAIGRRLSHRLVRQVVEASLAAADMLPFAGRAFPTLSGGEQQRVQFARALCQLEVGRLIEPRQTLLLDEPIASLDLAHQLAVLDAAKALTKRPSSPIAVMAILHDLNLAACYADHLVLLHAGGIVAQGAVKAVLTEANLEAVFGTTLRLHEVEGLPAFLPQARMLRAS